MEITLDKLAKNVADKALNDIKLDGKTIREWVEIIAKQQLCGDCISREAVEKITWEEPSYDDALNVLTEVRDKVRALPSVTPQQTSWIPIKTRPMTEEEKEEIGHEYAFMYDCPLPEDGQEVLITDCYGNVEIDTFYRDYEGFYFENNCDDGEVIAWMPKPEGHKEAEK